MGKKKRNKPKQKGKSTDTPMNDQSLLAYIASRKANGLNAEGGDLTLTRQQILNRYLGDPYGDERKGLSSVVTREVMEVVEWAMPSLMRIFAGDDLIVAFEATGAEDEAAAKQETEYVNHVFKKENDGFLVLHDFIKDALLSPTAYSKVWHEEAEEVTTERYEGLLEQDLMTLDQDPELTPVAQEEVIEMQVQFDPMTGIEIEQAVTTYNVEYKRVTVGGRCRVESVPPEELVIDEKLTGLDLGRADYVNHTTSTTKSDLLDMGFDKSIVDGLQTPERQVLEETDAREQYTDQETQDTHDDLFDLEESYVLVDWDGTGHTERRRVLSVGNTILSNEPDDYMPFVAMSAIKIPHVHPGLSFAELVEDLQRIKTTLTRQMLNNLYRVNNPRPIVGLGVNMQDLLNDAPNAPIRARDINDIRMEPTQAVISQVLPTLQHFDEVQNSRSGVSANTMGVDPSALAETTRGAYLGNLEQANQRLEMIARMFAETGIKQIFLKLHENLLRHQRDVAEFKLAGQWVPIDPTEWKKRTNMSVVVGIGYGTKEQQLVALNTIDESQKALKMNGAPIVSWQNIYNLQAKKAELANTGDPEKFFTDPAKMSEEQLNPPPPPDELAQAEMEMAKVEREKATLEHQRETFKLEQDNFKLQQENYKLQVQLRLEAQKVEQGDRKLDTDEMKVILDDQAKEDQLEFQYDQLATNTNNETQETPE